MFPEERLPVARSAVYFGTVWAFPGYLLVSFRRALVVVVSSLGAFRRNKHNQFETVSEGIISFGPVIEN